MSDKFYVEIPVSNFAFLAKKALSFFEEISEHDDVNNYVIRFTDSQAEICHKDEKTRLKAV